MFARREGIVRLAIFASLFVFWAIQVMAQSTLGTIRGSVTDSTGALVPDVNVVVRNVETNIERQTTTASTGNYEVTQLIPGLYEVTAEKAGFKKVVVANILLQTSMTVRSDVRLEVGEVATSVRVEAAAPVINTEGAEVAAVTSNQVLEKMPMNVRGQFDGFYYEMLTFIPGATRGQGSNFSLAGTRGSQFGATVDGTSQRSPLFGNSIGPAQSNMEMTGEIRVQLANDKAEASLPGGVYATSRSGTNEYHGSLFWYHSNSRLAARNTFSSSVPFQIQNNYGGSIGGPVVRNRTFFFTTYERFPLRNERIFNSSVPTAAFRNGDFSSLLPGTVIRDPLTGTPFNGNMIPEERLSQSSLKIQERFFPVPNFGSANSYQQNWRGTGASSQYKTQVEARLDHQLSAANSLFVRFSWNRTGANLWDYNLPTIPKRDQDRRSTTITISDNHLFGPTLINEFRFGIMRTKNPAFNPLDGPALIQEFGLQGISWNPELDKGAPVFSFNNFEEIGATDIYQDPSERIHQVVNNVTWTRGNHVVKSGIDIRWNRGTNFPGGTSFPVLQFGQFTFAGSYSGFDYSDFLLGIPQTAGRANAAPLIHALSTDMGLFVQDDWKITPKLTLNLGMRYEYNPPTHEKDDNFFNFDVTTGRVIVPSEAALSRVNPLFPSNLVPVVTAEEAGVPRSLWYTDLNNFVPRFGFAYRPFASNRTVIRGGYGIYTDDLTSSLWRLGTGGPFISRESFTNAITGGTPLFQFPNAFPPGFGAIGAQSFSAIDPKLRNPYIQQWNLTLEQEVFKMGVRLSYIGTSTRQLVWVKNVNQVAPSLDRFDPSKRPFPALRDVTVRVNGGNHNYHSMHLVAERKMLNGLYYQLGWTWAKNMTNCQTDGDGGCTPLNPYNLNAEWGNVDYTNRHRVAGTLLFELPIGRGKAFLSNLPRAADLAFGGWTLSSILVAQTGLFFSPTFSGFDVSNTNSTGTQRPDRVGDGNFPSSERVITKWFDKTAFVVPGDVTGDGRPDVNVGRFGNSAPNVIEGPGALLLDAGLHKQFRITERLRASLEGTFTNALNHPNYGSPNTNIRSGSVGRITSLYSRYGAGPRSGRVGLRIEF
ncbi:MAG TPA: TonB-dependent receptor [Bryobacteraceae bacterium]|nr:TonB-dependent receptor [Bryobacteraceae bacterium]